MKKRHWLRSFVAAVTASALVWTCAPVGAIAADSGTGAAPISTAASARTATLPVQGDGWSIDESGTLTIENDEGMKNWCNQSSVSYLQLVISVILQNSVTTIGVTAFGSCSSLKSITIPDSVTTIGDSAFSSCSSLESITIPDSVTTIGDGVFGSCSSLESVSIPNSITTIGDGAFFQCSSLKSMTIPNSVTSIGSQAFGYCSSLSSVTIPDSVTSIGWFAFEECTSLKTINLPKGVTALQPRIFEGCKNLTSITIPSTVTSIGANAFHGCINLSAITIPDNVKVIDDFAFSECSRLENIIFPTSTTSIGIQSFSECKNLKNVLIGDNVTYIGSNAFYNCNNLTVYCNSGSYAETYCIKNNIPYKPLSEYPGSGSSGLLLTTKSLTLQEGTTGNLSVFGVGQKTWTSADPNIATVSANGSGSSATVTAVSQGETTVTVTCGGDFDTAKIIVTPAATTEWFGKVLSNTTDSITIDIDGEHTLYVAPGVDLSFQENSLQDQYIYGTFDKENRIVSLKVLKPQVGTLTKISVNGVDDKAVTIDTGSDSVTYQWYKHSSMPSDSTNWLEKYVQYYANDDTIFLMRSVKTVIGTPTAVNTSSTPATATIDGKSYAIADGFVNSVSKVLNQKALFMLYNDQIEYAKALSSYAPHVDLSVSWNPDQVTYRNDQYNQTALKASVTLTNPSSNFPDGVDLNALKQQPELNVRFTGPITLELSDGNNNGDVGSFLCFGDKYSDPWFGDPKVKQDVEVPQEKTTLGVGDSVTLEVPVSINSKYVPEQGITKKSVNVAVTALPMTNGSGQTLEMPGGNSDTLFAAYPENAYVPMEDSEEVKDAAKEAAKELDKLDIEDIVVWIPSTNTIDSLLTKKQKNQIGIAALYTAISASTSEPVLTLEEQLNKDIVEKAFNKYFENWGFNQSVKNITFTLPMVLKTKDYGEIEFTITYTGGAYGMDDGGAFGQLGTLSYSITKGDLPAGFVKSGVCAYLAYADIDSFVNSCYDLIYSELKNAYDLAYGNDVNTIADALSCGAISDLLKNSKYKNLSGLTFAILTSFSTEYNAACPIDMYVYDGNNNLQGAIVGDQVVKTTEDAVMEVIPNGEDTIKRATLWNSTYHLKIVATDSGNMDITVNEKAGDDVLRTVKKDDIPLTTGDTFTTTLQPAYKTNDYVMRKTNGDQEEGTIEPTSDQSYLVIDTETGDDETPGGSDHPSTPGGSDTPTPPPSNPSNPGTPSNPASPESEMTTKVTLQNGRTVTISSPDDVIEIPQSSCFQVVFTNENDLDGFTLTAGNGKSIATDTVSAWNPATRKGTYTLYGLGAPGTANDTTGIYVNGVKLFTMKVVPRPLTSDTTIDFAMSVGQTYQFWVKPDDPDASYTFNTANGDMLQTAIVKDAYPDAEGRYLCRLTVTGRGDTVGVYCNIDGNTYKLFTVNCQ